MNVNLYVIEDYENETAFRPQKNKPKTKPILSFGCSSFKDFHFFCLKAPVEAGHMKTLEVAK